VACGRCAQCAEDRPNLCPNRRLMGMAFPGAFAEAITIPVDRLLPNPATLSDEVAALAEPLANALHVVDRSVRPAADVLVIGAGPIGLFAVRTAVLAGADRVFAVDRLTDRLELAREQGAVPVPAEDAAAAIDRITDGAGVDVVIDAVGLPPTWELAVAAARFGGRIEAIGLGAPEGSLAYHAVVTKGLSITGSFACVEADFRRAIELLAAGDPDPRGWITPMSLADGQGAFEALARGRHLKVVLSP
jgi:(R,R)-butanediol dehydrogenase/meso-butanediol dehydrogenase/diacetyl reductase